MYADGTIYALDVQSGTQAELTYENHYLRIVGAL